MKRLLVLLFLLCFLFSLPLVLSAEEPRFDVPIGDSPSRGPENAPITIIEFLDFQ